MGFAADDGQSGQAIHANFATEYELIEKRLRVGVNGYYLKQLTEDELDGTKMPDSKQQVLGLGPGLLYSFSPDLHLFINAYWESMAENRPEGQSVLARVVFHF